MQPEPAPFVWLLSTNYCKPLLATTCAKYQSQDSTSLQSGFCSMYSSTHAECQLHVLVRPKPCRRQQGFPRKQACELANINSKNVHVWIAPALHQSQANSYLCSVCFGVWFPGLQACAVPAQAWRRSQGGLQGSSAPQAPSIKISLTVA